MAMYVVVICLALGFLCQCMDAMFVPGLVHGILVLIECDFNHCSFSLPVCSPGD